MRESPARRVIRRYNEAEVADILERASSGAVHAVEPVEHGLTLVEIQEIGNEVGIASSDVANAAAVIGGPDGNAFTALRREAHQARVVSLARIPSDAEWDRMVVELREIFGETGTVERSGTLRSWTSPGVEVHGEPVGDGYRLRIDARNDDAVQAVVGGGVMFLVGLGMASVMFATGAADAVTLGASGLLGVLGSGMMTYGRVTLSRWQDRFRGLLSQTVKRLEAG